MKDRTIRAFATALAGVACLGLAACSGADAEPDLEEVEVTRADLPGMALQVDFVEIDGVRLTLDPGEGGFLTREEMLEESWDPVDAAADIDRFGLEAHHDQTFLGSALVRHPVFFACTGLSLYTTHEGATGDLDDSLQEVKDEVGTTSTDGNLLVDATTFEVNGVEDAVGMKMTGQTDTGRLFYSTMIAFVRGQVMGIVQVASLDDRDLTGEAAKMAGDLERQMASVTEE